MKRIVLLILFSWGFIMIGTIQQTMAGELSQVEKLTDAEKVLIQEKINAVKSAQLELEAARMTIAKNHKMLPESWMEWETWIEFSGDYILLFYRSHMGR